MVTVDADRVEAELAELFEMLPARWAAVPADERGDDAFGVFIRAAYARGYTVGLEERPR